jgi:hypothetical protein
VTLPPRRAPSRFSPIAFSRIAIPAPASESRGAWEARLLRGQLIREEPVCEQTVGLVPPVSLHLAELAADIAERVLKADDCALINVFRDAVSSGSSPGRDVSSPR